MSDTVNDMLETVGLGKGKRRKKPQGVPTIDEAREAQIETDRIRRRRGSLANIFGGAQASAPSVSAKKLLGS